MLVETPLVDYIVCQHREEQRHHFPKVRVRVTWGGSAMVRVQRWTPKGPLSYSSEMRLGGYRWLEELTDEERTKAFRKLKALVSKLSEVIVGK